LRSGELARVTAEVERSGDEEARVRFALAERPRFHLGYGVRWESGRGESAVVDAVDSSFLGRGLTLALRALYEPDDQSGRLFLRTGAFTRGGISLEVYGQGRRRMVEENFLEDSVESALQLARPFGRRTTVRLYARYRTTRLYEEEPDPFFPLDIELASPHAGIQLLYDALDDPLDPTRGLLATLDLSGSGPWIGGDFDYARTFGQIQLYRRGALGGRPFVWAQALRFGWARAFGGQELLRFERFFAGGEHSVRGYETESLGPQEVLGQLVRPLGGEALLVVNEELRVALPWDLTGVAFLDAGQVWDDPGDFGSSLATAAGLGLRARTPIGLLRLDAAFPFDRRPEDESWRLYLGFGNAF
jgi:outer membrane protein assembly factor BamA